MTTKKETVTLNSLFFSRPEKDGTILSHYLYAIFDARAIKALDLWLAVNNGKHEKLGFDVFLALTKLVEAIALYDAIIIWQGGYTLMSTNTIKILRDNDIILKNDKLREISQNISQYSEKYIDLELLKVAKNLYPKFFHDFMKYQDSCYKRFFHNIYSIAFSHALRLPLIPDYFDELSCILIRRKLLAFQALTSLDMVYGEVLNEMFPIMERIFNAKLVDGLLTTPVVYKWLKIVNQKSAKKYEQIIEIALDIRRELKKTREYLRELSFALCEPAGSFVSYRRALKRIEELRRALMELADPQGERIFIFHFPDLIKLIPSISTLAKSMNLGAILKKLSGKQIDWWAKRIKYRKAFHLFSLFDNFFNSRNVTQEVSKFLNGNIDPRQLQWIKYRDFKLKNSHRFRLLDDDENFEIEFGPPIT